ncbi:MAG: hypothetical protein ACRDRA_06715 [Pseudonocardiaceae bacterium]
MRKLRVRCQTCDDVVVTTDEIVVTSRTPSPSSYAFHCPWCRSVVERHCAEAIARLLLLNGARTEPRSVPTAGNPVFGLGHVEELHRVLDRPDWLSLLRNVGT